MLTKPHLGCSGVVMKKLNQKKICISHHAPLSAETSSCLNVEGNGMKWYGEEETEPMKIVGIGHYEKIEKWPPFHKIICIV